MESLDAKKFGGYDVYFLQELSDKYECPICIMALRKPILTKCGHRLCLSCSEEMRTRNNGVLVCPLDNTNLKPEQNHLGSCEYEEVKCLNEQCTTSILRKELSDHMETKCIYRLINCQHCNQKILSCENQIHLETCECLLLYCVNQCGMKIFRKEISSHIIDSCANAIIPCQYYYIGCNFKGMRKEQDTHVNSSTQNHLSMAISKVVALENKIMLNEKEMEAKMTILKNEMEIRKEQDAQVESLTQNQFLTTSKVVELEKKILLIEKEMKTKITKPNNEQFVSGYYVVCMVLNCCDLAKFTKRLLTLLAKWCTLL
ncbi:TNF receptor-associated factor 3-like isoform X3 [Hydra vulgaris]|uniref:TNF receptor-associated factor 3-like isoform X3 n=1 Tax=Hydra vulgaris TaxID=6087 RepID=A0ABM4DKJ8_HYDVU